MSCSSLIFRRPIPDDWERVMAVMPAWWDGRDLRAMLPRVFFEHFRGTSLLVEHEDRLVAFLVGFFCADHSDEAYVHFVGVAPEWRRAGLAGDLYRRFAALARTDGRTAVRAVTAPANTGSIAELELYSGDARVEGEPFGTAANGETESSFKDALDGDIKTAFEGASDGGSYVGLDVAGDAVAKAPTFSPEPGNFDQAPEVELDSATPGVAIRYTLDGSNPTRSNGLVYKGTIKPQGRASIKAVAYADCLFESPLASASYGVGDDKVTRGLKTYHLGNSLTDTINPWLKPIADSTGVEHTYARWTIPGAQVSWLWEHPGQGFGEPAGAGFIETFAAQYAPIDHISLQPFADPSLDKEGPAALNLLKPVLASSPDVQVWIYAQWPPRDMPGQKDVFKTSSFATGANWALPPWKVERQPNNWEEAVENSRTYHEAFRAWVDERIPGKQVLVVPGGSALVKLKQAIDKGEIPGVTNFYDEHFSDDLHLSEKGQYMVALAFYSALYRQSPEGRVTSARTGLTEAQAKSYQRIAWETVSTYKWSGLAP
jgi:GNAT superfamily N-acetyltransferase